MEKVLVIAEGPSPVHIGRPLSLANRLHSSGMEVHFAAGIHFQSLYSDSPFETHRIRSRPPSDVQEVLARNEILFPADLIREYVKDDLDLISRVQPDAIIGDFRRSLTISAVVTGVPLLSVTNSYWSPYAIDRVFPPPFDRELERISRESPDQVDTAVQVAEENFNTLLPEIFRVQAHGLDVVRREWGMSPFPDYLTGATWGNRVLYADLPTLVGLERIPDSHLFLGPVCWNSKAEVPIWWSKIPATARVVYVCAESFGLRDILNSILRIAGRFDAYFVIAGRYKFEEITLPENCFAEQTLPEDLVMSRACLMISNGGGQSAYQALKVGVPVLGIPAQIDQLLCMRHLRRSGAAGYVRADCLTDEALFEALLWMFENDSYQRAAQMIGQQCGNIDFSTECSNAVREVVGYPRTEIVENG